MVNVHESDYEQYNEYSFHFGLLFFRFLRIEQTDLDQFVGHVEERLAFLQGAFWKQQTFQHDAVRARICCARTAALVEMSLLFQRDFGPNTPGPRPSKNRQAPARAV